MIKRNTASKRAALETSVGVTHHWLIDLDACTLTAYRLESGRWLELGIYGDEHDARIEPFDEVSLDVASWWP